MNPRFNPAAALERRAVLGLALVGTASAVLRSRRGLATPPDLLCDDRPSGTCVATEPDIEGPYYLPGAPRRDVLLEPGMEGTRLELTGVVRSTRCEPLAGAVLELWQCDARGRYDERGMRLRCRLESSRDGHWGLQTIVPGRYLNGAQYRPAHLHVKLHAPGHRPLTTQLYFHGDPHNAADPWFRPSRALRLASAGGGALLARYDLVLARA